VVAHLGQRRSISAASAVNARGGFWYCTYEGGLTAETLPWLIRSFFEAPIVAYITDC